MQEANFNHLKQYVNSQIKVRRCEIEGSVYDLESRIWEVAYLELISFSQADHLIECLSEDRLVN